MFYPILNAVSASRLSVQEFGGLNRRAVIADGEWADMENLSSRHWPAAGTRPGRRQITQLDGKDPTGSVAMVQKDGLLWLDAQGTLHGGGHELPEFADPSDGKPRHLVCMGAYVLVFPDKRWCNAARLCAGTLGFRDYGSLEEMYTTGARVSLHMCLADGTDLLLLPSSTQPPADPENGDYWLDRGSYPRVLRQWSEAEHYWKEVPDACIRIEAEEIGARFRAGDTVQLENLAVSGEGNMEGQQVLDLMAQPQTIQNCGDGYIILRGTLDGACSMLPYRTLLIYDIQRMDPSYDTDTLAPMSNDELEALADQLGDRTAYPFRITRPVPDLDFAVCSGNRIWGCRYDPDAQPPVNEIYASVLGDFSNWNRFEGQPGDAYRASRGADGPFTGAVEYSGGVLFFRANSVEKVYPDAGGAHQIVTTPLDGVAPGCGDSLQLVDNVLYYLSAGGVMAYDGSLPVCISQALGPLSAQRAVAGRLAERYYLSLQNPAGAQLLVYDTHRGMWHREDDTAFGFCCPAQTALYCTDAEGRLWDAAADAPEADLTWMLQTGLLQLQEPDRHFAGRMELRLELTDRCSLEIQYDSDGVWHPCAEAAGAGIHTLVVPVRARRCAHVQLRLKGQGQMRLYSLTRQLQQGSERA